MGSGRAAGRMGGGWARRARGLAARGRRPGRHPYPHTVAHGGNCTNRAATRRRHAVKQLLMLQNPHRPGLQAPHGPEGTTRIEQPGHDAWERLQRPRPRQLNHHERSLGSAAPSAAPASDVPTRRVTGPQRSWLSGYHPRATTDPERKPTSGYLNNLSGCAQPIRMRITYPDSPSQKPRPGPQRSQRAPHPPTGHQPTAWPSSPQATSPLPGRRYHRPPAPGRQHIRIGNQHPDRKPTSGYLNNLSGCA